MDHHGAARLVMTLSGVMTSSEPGSGPELNSEPTPSRHGEAQSAAAIQAAYGSPRRYAPRDDIEWRDGIERAGEGAPS